MKRAVLLPALFWLVAGVSGCVIGNWNICGPQTPLYHCDAEAERRLLHPTPNRDYWTQSGIVPDIRSSDWVDCGGNDKGGYYVGFEIDGSPSKAAQQVNHSIQRCMLKKGYQYTGPCDNEITKAFPGCGAP